MHRPFPPLSRMLDSEHHSSSPRAIISVTSRTRSAAPCSPPHRGGDGRCGKPCPCSSGRSNITGSASMPCLPAARRSLPARQPRVVRRGALRTASARHPAPGSQGEPLRRGAAALSGSDARPRRHLGLSAGASSSRFPFPSPTTPAPKDNCESGRWSRISSEASGSDAARGRRLIGSPALARPRGPE